MTTLVSETVPHDDEHDEYLQEIRTAIVRGDASSLLSITRTKSDVHTDLGQVKCGGRTYASCTPLCLAALTGQSEVARALLQRGASLEKSTYSVEVGGKGSSHYTWRATAVFAAASCGDLGLLQDLIELQADINSRLDTGANLVWHASQFGCDEIVEWLLFQRVDPHVAAWSPEGKSSQHTQTSLHIAARCAGAKAVRALLAAGARVSASDEFGLTPLDEAIVSARPEAVTLLMEYRAQLMSEEHPKVKTFWQSGKPVKSAKSSIQLLFEHSNATTIAAAAEGLKFAPEQASRLRGESTSYLVQFLSTPGDAPLHICRALFHPATLRSSYGENSTDIKTAFLSDGFRASEGPDELDLEHLSHDSLLRFVDGLAPQSPFSWYDSHVPIDIFRCVVPSLSAHPEVLQALVKGPNVAVFDEPGCRALVEFLHDQWRPLQVVVVLFMAVHIAVLLMVNLALNSGWSVLVEIDAWLYIGILLTLWIFNWADVLAQVLGFLDFGLGAYYWGNLRSWIDTLSLLISGAVIAGLTIRKVADDDRDSKALNVLLAVSVFLQWSKLLQGLRAHWKFGESILPIFVAIRSVLPITGVVIFGVLGLSHSYYALGLQHSTAWDLLFALQASYRLLVLGDANLDELDGTDDTMAGSTSSWYGHSKFRYVLLVGFVVVTFATTVTLMNTFIAVLCVSYQKAELHSKRDFLHERACLVLNRMALLRGWQALWHCSSGWICCRFHRKQDAHPSNKYVWYALSAVNSLSTDEASQCGTLGMRQNVVANLQDRVAKQSDQLCKISSQLFEVQAALNKLGCGGSTKASRRKKKDSEVALTKIMPPHPTAHAAHGAHVAHAPDMHFARVPVSVHAVNDLDLAGTPQSPSHTAHSYRHAFAQAHDHRVQVERSPWSPSNTATHGMVNSQGLQLPYAPETWQATEVSMPTMINSPNVLAPHRVSPISSASIRASPPTQSPLGSSLGSTMPRPMSVGSPQVEMLRPGPHLAHASAAAASDAAAWQACSQGIAALRQQVQDGRPKPPETAHQRAMRRVPTTRHASAPASGRNHVPSNSGVLLARTESPRQDKTLRI